MKTVTGTVHTQYGPATFSMTDERRAVLFIKKTWTVHGIEYQGHIDVYKVPEGNDDYQAIEGWREASGSAYLKRVDNRDIDALGKTYAKIKMGLLKGFVFYITHPKNTFTLKMAELVKMENQRDELGSKEGAALRRYEEAIEAVEKWDDTNYEKLSTLKRDILQRVVEGNIQAKMEDK